MNTIQQLEIILARFERCPLNLVRVELEMFVRTLKSDPNLNTVMTKIILSNERELGARASTFVNNISSSSWTDLSFASSAALRAAVGYQLCECLLGEPNPIKCGKNVVQIGAFYSAYQGKSGQVPQSDLISVFSEVFLHPLVAFLRGSLELHHRILLLLSRYRQRSEWFIEEEKINAILENKGEIEKQLKRDFFLYLFDNEIDFSIESEVPVGGGEVDILATLPDLGYLPIEVKVFDGEKRNASYISAGLAQTCDYARKFNSADAYYIVYNVANNKLLSLPGISNVSNVISVNMAPVTIHAIVINLRITLPASRAAKLESVVITLPTLAH